MDFKSVENNTTVYILQGNHFQFANKPQTKTTKKKSN